RLGRTNPPARADAAGLGRARAGGFVLPSLVLIVLFLVVPALWTLYLGVTNYRLTGLAAADPQVVGLDNYVAALGDERFHTSLWLTLQFVLGSAVLGQAGLGFAIAWSLRDRRGPVRRVVEALVLLAWILPSSVVAFLWIALLDRDAGTLNALLGLPGTAWLLDHPMLSVILFNTWRGTAFSMMLYAAALQNVPPSHLETARLAGASTWQQLRDVVFPRIRGHVLTNLLLISLWTFNDFTPFLITAGGPEQRSEILPVYVYKIALSGGELGFGAAISFLMLLINLVIALVYLRTLGERRKDRR
ncbi:carbohydrate ABC transporter permease, partial [Plantactinospora alkalitolerans]|uniref:carbohydrate ABC transporter permease n=1 Tax=Plantactinospora alkalitolerans TaxID=2789879 RepID=UPI001E58F702